MTRYVIEVKSTSDFYKTYEIEIDTDKQTVDCGCRGGRIHGRCKHVRFYKKLIRDLLRENPGFEREKGGK